VFVYTVNDPADIQTAQAMGVDGIISDYPEQLL
jgi:glycerophosphoryl diester phosphodiesterase